MLASTPPLTNLREMFDLPDMEANFFERQGVSAKLHTNHYLKTKKKTKIGMSETARDQSVYIWGRSLLNNPKRSYFLIRKTFEK